MNIGETIKKLRRSKDMTQEQIAEYLNVSTQAVSRWETGASLPDITQVPALANILETSADVLLGVDVTARESQIKAIREKAEELKTNRQRAEAEKVLRAGLREFVNSYTLMRDLAYVLRDQYAALPAEIDGKPNAERMAIIGEVISLCEKILAECTDDDIRHATVQTLCFAHVDAGQRDKAVALAKTMPQGVTAQDQLLTGIYTGTELQRHKQWKLHYDAMYSVMSNMMNYNVKLDDGTDAYTVEERIEICRKVFALNKIFYDNEEDLTRYNPVLNFTHRSAAQLYARIGDQENAIAHLREAADAYIIFNRKYAPGSDYGENKSLLFRGRSCGTLNDTPKMRKEIFQNLLDNMKIPAYDAIRQDLEFIAIEDELRQCIAETEA